MRSVLLVTAWLGVYETIIVSLVDHVETQASHKAESTVAIWPLRLPEIETRPSGRPCPLARLRLALILAMPSTVARTETGKDRRPYGQKRCGPTTATKPKDRLPGTTADTARLTITVSR
ncbi:hypothetical protein KPB2_5582 [Klebsiella pneumoniae Kb677]|nr:hypothetical protein KPB2_5582 [Klebsiella pneumoniae Kb677]